jgi:hypothetical protein
MQQKRADAGRPFGLANDAHFPRLASISDLRFRMVREHRSRGLSLRQCERTPPQRAHYCGGIKSGDISPSRSIRRLAKKPFRRELLSGMNPSSSGSSAYARSRGGGNVRDGRCLAISDGSFGFFLTCFFTGFGLWSGKLGLCSARVRATLLPPCGEPGVVTRWVSIHPVFPEVGWPLKRAGLVCCKDGVTQTRDRWKPC